MKDLENQEEVFFEYGKGMCFIQSCCADMKKCCKKYKKGKRCKKCPGNLKK